MAKAGGASALEKALAGGGGSGGSHGGGALARMRSKVREKVLLVVALVMPLLALIAGSTLAHFFLGDWIATLALWIGLLPEWTVHTFSGYQGNIPSGVILIPAILGMLVFAGWRTIMDGRLDPPEMSCVLLVFSIGKGVEGQMREVCAWIAERGHDLGLVTLGRLLPLNTITGQLIDLAMCLIAVTCIFLGVRLQKDHG